MEHEVGTVVELTEDERADLESRQVDICALQQELGTLREEYIAKDAILCKMLGEKRRSYHERMVSVSEAHEIDFSSNEVCWKWHPDRLVFTRVK